MRKITAIMAVTCLCALITIAIVGCSAPTKPSSSETFSSASDVSEPKQLSSEHITKPITEPIYVLLIGNDSRYQTVEGNGVSETDPSFSDTMMLVRLDPTTNSIAICSIPRDTKCIFNGEEMKVNDVHCTGNNDHLVGVIGDMFGVNVSYWFDMRFIQFIDFIDRFGGVDANVPINMSWPDIKTGEGVDLTAGEQHLDGAQALTLVRVRKLYEGDGEAIRQLLSRTLVANMIQLVANQPASDAPKYADMLLSNCKTNMPAENLQEYMVAYMNQDNPIAFTLGTGPYVTSQDASGMWSIEYEPDTYKALGKAMETDDDMSAIVAPPDVH